MLFLKTMELTCCACFFYNYNSKLKSYSIYSTCKTYIEWQANPTITTINTTAYPIENIEFPAITICSQGAAKNVMETVLVKQFETYLEEKGINGSSGTMNNTASSSGRRKLSTGSISKILTKDEALICDSI